MDWKRGVQKTKLYSIQCGCLFASLKRFIDDYLFEIKSI